MTTDSFPRVAQHHENATFVRAFIADLYDAGPPEDIVLAPGALVALHTALHFFGVRTLLLSSEEYYGPQHFPGLRVVVAHPTDIVQVAHQFRPEAILLSSVSWKGNVLPVQQIFSQVRQQIADPPVLVLDHMHGGAAGFPSVREAKADIVVGDVEKWVLASSELHPTLNLAYMWASPARSPLLSTVFSPFYLATSRPAAGFAARWISPQVLDYFASEVRRLKLNRRRLREQHALNMRLAEKIATLCGLADPSSAILMLPSESADKLSQQFPSSLVTGDAKSGIRLLCRSFIDQEFGSAALRVER